jgi:hypothetical protein
MCVGCHNSRKTIEKALLCPYSGCPFSALANIIQKTYSHVDGRDLFKEFKGRHHMDLIVRRDGLDHQYEADWIDYLADEIKKAQREVFGEKRK